MELSKKQKTKRLCETALMLALSVVLAEFAVIKLPYGGSVTLFSQLPVLLISYRFGIKWGMGAGLTLAVSQMLFGFENFSYVSGVAAYFILVLFDYVIAFTVLGAGGIFRRFFKNQTAALCTGAAVVSAVRFICHFISGVTIWQAYAGDLPVWKYSLVYNGGFMLPELIITVAGVAGVSLLFELGGENVRIRNRANAHANVKKP